MDLQNRRSCARSDEDEMSFSGVMLSAIKMLALSRILVAAFVEVESSNPQLVQLGGDCKENVVDAVDG